MRQVVWLVIAAIACLDLVTGIYLLVSPTPWLVNGPDTLWTQLGESTHSSDAALGVRSLFQRIGAFSVFAALSTLVWLGYGIRRDRTVITVLLLSYMLAGVVFMIPDSLYFKGTPYFVFKQAIGAAWAVAFVLHIIAGRRPGSHRA